MEYCKWLIVVALCVCVGCAHAQKVKIVADVTPEGEVTYHTEYVAEF